VEHDTSMHEMLPTVTATISVIFIAFLLAGHAVTMRS
jgi:hypothetical protein